ncbi:fumarylacetoacetate hydrolase family protein [Microbacterium sp. 2FI]|uniref:fumarylacetoacetate hydrolase family protein n=1 Tax=Microbacterium sp. 2FI TaxID=2502193 RepID=UPI0010F7185D|nr:fumarylacetoacetate hydrolase family protein [Microbacterium sp. 2FI]
MTPITTTDSAALLPEDGTTGVLAGRVWVPRVGGPSVVAVRAEGVVDLSATFSTMRAVTESPTPAAAVAAASGPVLCSLDDLVANTAPDTRDAGRPWLLSPIDLQVVKAAGVTFPLSMLERIIEERARGEKDAALGIRAEITAAIGGELDTLIPGSPEAARVKAALIERGLWSQYLEVGIGPDAEVFTKAPVLASVGTGVDVGIHSSSEWNNPEPEIVLVVSSRGDVVGATLGNDVNLRDIEGRSALLLPKAKDNNGSAAIGPFLRLFDASYGMDDVRAAVVTLTVAGVDGYTLRAQSPLSAIARDPLDIVSQVVGDHHQYPDGFVLFLGTLFAPVEDRDAVGRGFTHHLDDVVRIAEPRLGSITNRVRLSEEIEPWTFGIAALFENLTQRGLLR